MVMNFDHEQYIMKQNEMIIKILDFIKVSFKTAEYPLRV
jgi:hypothetical protein